MPYGTIFRYSASSALFAAIVCAVWFIARVPFIVKKGRFDPAREGLYLACAAYLGALFQITALRIGLVTPQWLGGSINPGLMMTTAAQAGMGFGSLVYHIAGNMVWFVPLGFLLPVVSGRCRLLHVLAAGTGLSMIVEGCQFILGTGISDIDDVLFNALGAVLGYLLFLLLRRMIRGNRR